ncbi:MAG: acyl-CoA dehydrogenase family protein [Defluviimonas denitrificans]
MPAETALRLVQALDHQLPRLAEAADAQETDAEAWRTVWSDPQMRAISYVGVPDAITPYRFAEAGLGAECGHALHLALVERLSRGAASAMMALPASAMSTRAVLRLGTEDQIERFFRPFSDGAAWTFFGVTEPAVGSDAGQCRMRLDPAGSGWFLTGEKTLIGGATLAQRGLVLATDRMQLRLAMVMQAADGRAFCAEKLPMTGLCGAGISHLRFDGLAIGAEDILAIDSRRPVMLTLADVFEKHRPMVGAMALGTGRAMLDRLAEGGATGGFDDLLREHGALLRRMVGLGVQADTGPLPVHAVSQFKRQATAFTDRVRARIAARAPAILLADRRMRRLWRDAGAFEYMEGTTAIHSLNAYRDYVTREVLHDRAV